MVSAGIVEKLSSTRGASDVQRSRRLALLQEIGVDVIAHPTKRMNKGATRDDVALHPSGFFSHGTGDSSEAE